MKIDFSRILLAALLGVFLYGAFVVYTGYQELADVLADFHAWTFAAALGLASTNYLLRFLKWQYYLKLLDIRGVRPLDSFLVFLSGFVLTVTPGKVGEVFKSAVLSKTHDIAAERTASIVVAERLTDVLAIVLLLVLGSASLGGSLFWAGLGAVALTTGFVAIFWSGPVLWGLTQLERGWLRAFIPKLRHAYDQLRKLASPRALGIPTLLSLVGWGCEGFGLYLLLLGFGQHVDHWHATFFYATATLAGALVPVPGGLGVAEALLQQQLVRIAGVAIGAATASMLLIRFATLWWAVIVGFLALAALRLRFAAQFTSAPKVGLERP